MKERTYNVLELFRLWNSDLRTDEVASRLGISVKKLSRAVHRHGLQRRAPLPRSVANRPNDPTPGEIEMECAKFQRGWSEIERRQREVGGRKRWAIPVI